MATKIVINACYGGFSLSPAAVRRAKELAPDDKRWQAVDENYGFLEEGLRRHDPVLVRVVEEMEEAASGSCANLVIDEIEGLYLIKEYDGFERVITPEDCKNWPWVDPRAY